MREKKRAFNKKLKALLKKQKKCFSTLEIYDIDTKNQKFLHLFLKKLKKN